MVATRDVATHLSGIEQTLIGLQSLQRGSPGAVLFREGEQADGVYIVHSGTVDLVFAARNGIVKPLQTADAGQIVGLSSVVSGRPHDSTAVVRTAGELGYVDAKRLLQLLEQNPSAWFEVLHFLSQDIASCWDSIRRIAAPH